MIKTFRRWGSAARVNIDAINFPISMRPSELGTAKSRVFKFKFFLLAFLLSTPNSHSRCTCTYHQLTHHRYVLPTFSQIHIQQLTPSQPLAPITSFLPSEGKPHPSMLRLAVEGVVGAVEQLLYPRIQTHCKNKFYQKNLHSSRQLNVMFSPTRACLLAFYISPAVKLLFKPYLSSILYHIQCTQFLDASQIIIYPHPDIAN